MCSGGGGGGSVSKDTAVQERQAAIAQNLEDDYQLRFMPIERELINYASDKSMITTAANDAKVTSAAAFDAGQSLVTDNLSSYGMGMTGAQQNTHNRMQLLNRNGAKVVAANTARESTDTRLDNLSSQMVNLGRQAQGQGLDGFNTASSIENQRNQEAINGNAQQQSGGYGVLGTAVGIGASLLL